MIEEKDAAQDCVSALSDVLTYAIPGDPEGSEKAWWERFAADTQCGEVWNEAF